MSKYLVELELEQSFDDWLQEMRWKRNHDFKAFDAALSECQQLAREEVSAERERCAKYCETMAAYWARCGNNTAEEAAKALAMGIRGKGC